MDPLESSLLRETLKRNRLGVRFASIFGSFRRGDSDQLSDVDVFIVCEDESDRPVIVNSLTKLSSKIRREIHPITFTLKGFEERIRNHDYLITSILDDSSLIFGDEAAFLNAKRRIFAGPLNTDSGRFNVRMGLRMLNFANDRLGNLLFNQPFIRNLDNFRNNVALACLRDYHLGLGYLAASEKMKQLNEAISLRQLLASGDHPLIRDLILAEKSMMRSGTISLIDLKNLLNYSKSLVNTQNSL